VFPPTVDSRNVANEAVSARLAMAGG
jgi:hypothetical protein